MKLEKTRGFWTYIVFGVLCIAVGAALMPVWAGVDVFFSSWGNYSVNIIISGLILGYILFYLIKRIKRYSNTPAQVVSIVELVVMAVIAAVCTASLFVDSISFGEPCQIFALVVWARGVSGVFTGYYCDSNIVKAAEEEKRAKKSAGKLPALEDLKKEEIKETKIDTEAEPKGRVDDFTVWRLSFSVILISVGVYLFVDPVIKLIHMQWVFSCTAMAVGLFFAVFGMAKKPTKVTVEKSSPETKKEKEKKSADGAKAEAKGEEAKKAPAAKEEKPAADKAPAEKKAEEKAEKAEDAPQLEGAKVSIKVSGESANAMTQTAMYDAVEKEK